jgi:BON domain-containing protein
MLSCGKNAGNDQTLATDIQNKLSADAVTKPANVGVAVKDGVVTLSGDVPSSDVELEAMKVANGTAGVRTVNDQMKVNPSLAANQLPNAGTPAPPPQAEPAPPEPAPAAAPTRPAEPTTVTIPAGTQVSVRTIDAIDSKNAAPGQTFQASLQAPLVAHDRVVVPAGTPAALTVTSAKGAGRIKGSSELSVQLSRIDYKGRSYEVSSAPIEQQGKGRGKQTGVRTGVGAAAGSIIGAIAGGGKGAAIGAAVGGGAGFGSAALTHGQQVKIPSETVLTFSLEAPLRIRR